MWRIYAAAAADDDDVSFICEKYLNFIINFLLLFNIIVSIQMMRLDFCVDDMNWKFCFEYRFCLIG